MPAFFSLALMRQLPLRAVLPQAKQFFAFSQNISRKVVKRVHLVGAPRFQPKTRRAELSRQSPQIANAELDVDFTAHRRECITEYGQMLRERSGRFQRTLVLALPSTLQARPGRLRDHL